MAGFNRELREMRQLAPVLCAWLLPELDWYYCAARSGFFSPSEARAQQGRMERGDEKPRGRGLGQRNTNLANLNVYLRVKQTFS